MNSDTGQQAQYVALLRGHDWSYQYSDDHRAWSRGESERHQLRHLQRTIDADGAVWNAHAPAYCKLQVATC